MPIGHQLDALIATLDETAQDVISFFTGMGANSRVKVGVWGPQEVLSHLLFWHEVSARGMESVAGGGEPYSVDASADDLNARAVASQSEVSYPQLITQLQSLQERLVRAARALPDPETVVMRRFDGTPVSGRGRLEMINRHMKEHFEAFRGETGQKT